MKTSLNPHGTKASAKARKTRIYLLSDSTGELAERFTNALITQFPSSQFVLEKFNFIENPLQVLGVLQQVEEDGKRILFHTVLSPKLKSFIERECRKRGVPSYDLTGPPTDFMAKNFHAKPVWNLRSIHRMDEAYDKRIDAIEFTMSHDDGAGEATIQRAQIILVGPSRTSKTPTSIYLALKGYRVANISLIEQVGDMPVLSRIEGDPRVIAFAIDPLKLREVRLVRATEFGSQADNYTDLRAISREVNWARELYRKYRWKTVDVTHRAIEETAAIVMRSIERPRASRLG